MRIFTTSILIAASLTLSLNTKATDLQNINDYPKWFQEAMAAEGNLDKRSNIEIEALGMKSEVLGKFTLEEQDGSYWYYTVDIGSATPMECYAFTSFDGGANSLHNVMSMSIDNTAAANEMELSSTVNYAIESGVIDDTPFIAADIQYTISNDATALTGVVKGKAAETNQSLQVCLHNELGYRDTFSRVFSSFVEAFTKTEPDPEFFEVVYELSVNGMNVGFAEETYTIDADGDVAITNNSAMFMPVDASSLMRIDSVSDTWSRSDGALINASEYTVQNGALGSQLSLAYNGEVWEVAGEMQGKEVSVKLEHDGGFLSGFGSYLVLEELRKSADTTGEYTMWSSSVDPSSAIQVKLSQIANNPNANFEVDMGPMVMQFFADEQGKFQKGTIDQGPVKLDMKLVYSRGTPIITPTSTNAE